MEASMQMADVLARNLAVTTEALRAIIARSNNDPLGTSKVNDMRRIAEDALAILSASYR
jgi:hypothetical protein